MNHRDPADSEPCDPLELMAEEFLDRRKRGERPSIDGYVARLPDRAEEVRQFLSALVLVEDLKPRSDEESNRVGGCALVGDGRRIDRLGDYRILREIGRGGMGVVYEAEQGSLGRRVALKVLAPWTQPTSQQIRRFHREARSAAQLHHSNIVPVFGVGEHDGIHYYAMQFIQGLGLDEVLREVRRLQAPDTASVEAGPAAEAPVPPADRGSTPNVNTGPATIVAWSMLTGRFAPGPPSGDPIEQWVVSSGVPTSLERSVGATSVSLLSPSSMTLDTDSDRRYTRSVARVGVQVSEALQYAHEQGMLHRDIKPSNLLLDAHGTVWVTDFGLAKARDDEDLTRTGDLVGTLRYMAPERFHGLCDARSDVYALGLSLYELLALQPAFGASDRHELIHQVLHDDPPRLGTLRPSIPRDLETIVHKAIEKAPSHRYASAGAMADDLRRFLEDRTIEARRVGRGERLVRWARRNPGIAVLSASVVALLLLIAVISTAAAITAMTLLNRAHLAEQDARRKLWESSLARARAGRWSGRMGRRFEGLEALAEAAALDVFPDRRDELRSEAIACLTLTDLRIDRRWDGVPAGAEHLGMAFDAKLERYARAEGDGHGTISVRRVADDRELARLPGPVPGPAMLRFDPLGHWLAVKYDSGPKPMLAVWDLDRRAMVLRKPDGVHAEAIDFSPDGRVLAAGRRDGSIDLYDLDESGKVRRLPPGPVPHSIRFDPEGRRLAVSRLDESAPVQIRDVATGAVLAEHRPSVPARGLAWHPDGRHLAIARDDGGIDLVIADDPAAPSRRLDGHQNPVISLAFNQAGDLLASASWDATVRLWDVREGRELLAAPSAEGWCVQFSPDDRRLAAGRDGASLWLWEVAPGQAFRTSHAPDGQRRSTWSVDFHPDGGLLASAGFEGVRLIATESSREVAFLPMVRLHQAIFAPDGRSLITSGEWGLQRWPIEPDPDTPAGRRVGPPAPIGLTPGLPTERIAVSLDGRTLVAVTDWWSGRALVLDLERGGPPVVLQNHPGLERIAISPDGRWIATGTWRGRGVAVWDARSGRRVRDLDISGSADVAFSPDGQWLVTGSGRAFRFWEVGSWRPDRSIARRYAGEQPGKLAYSPDGSLLAITRSRSLVTLIDPTSGEELSTLEPPESRHIASMAFSPDGGLLATTFNTDQVRLWNMRDIRHQLDRLGLDWSSTPTSAYTDTEHEAPPVSSVRLVFPAWLADIEHGDAMAEQRRWDDAIRSFRAAIEAGATAPEHWRRLATAQLARLDRAGYQRTCQAMLDHFGPTEEPDAAADLVWTCVIGPDATTDPEQLVRLAEVAARGLFGYSRHQLLGVALYRAGQFEQAVDRLERAVEEHGAGGERDDWLFLAMALHHLGREDNARRWLDRIGPLDEYPTPGELDSMTSLPWYRRTTIDVLHDEVSSVCHVNPSR